MLTVTRQDAWNEEEDLTLAEVVLRHICEGSTQLAAFEEVGERLSRTAAACGFRWNSLVRKKYKAEIAFAKNQRKQLKQKASKKVSQSHIAIRPDVSLNEVIPYLESFRTLEQDHEELKKQNEFLTSEVSRLKKENEKLCGETAEYRKEANRMQEDYRSLIAIMERARKTVF